MLRVHVCDTIEHSVFRNMSTSGHPPQKPLGLLSNIIIKPVSTVSPHVMRLLLFTKRNSVTSSETVSNTRPGAEGLFGLSLRSFFITI